MLYRAHPFQRLIAATFVLTIAMARASGQAAERPGEWTMPGKDFAATRYSSLAQISAANVQRLRMVWNFSTGVLRGHEGQPLVVNNTMYVVTPYPNVLYAFDLTKEGYPLKWKYRPDVSRAALGVACCDAINRGAFYANGKIVYNLLDGHTVAVDAKTGKELWNVKIADLTDGETTPMAPLVVRDRVIVGPSGGEFGIHGWTKALDLATGRVAWTAYNEGPDSDVLARAGSFKPFYDRGADLALKSWPADAWKHAGAPVWGWLSYDPELDLIYYGVGNPGPYNPEQRPGDNKWTNSVLARRPGDGSLVWAYQFTPHDNWDYDSNAEMILASLVIKGRQRRVLVHFDKNGFAYTMDRATGEVLVAEPFAHLNWAKRIDLVSGRPVLDSTKYTGASKGVVNNICPSLEGGKSPASPAAYSPRTGLFYVSTLNVCMSYEASKVGRIRGTPYIGANTPYQAGPGGTSARSSRGTRCTAERPGRSRRSTRYGAGYSRQAETWCSTARWTDGSRRPTRVPEKFSGSSRRVPALSALPSPSPVPTASSTSRCMPALEATGRSSLATFDLTIPPTCETLRTSSRTSGVTRVRVE
ncbi:MAG TPA: PQQ-dependent dehydrogenase, methanol/ethanol family [Gemmatimonadaceae bacterium]|nr:PQQ-dependent dehydrogenase, methanol/ethanol family [Gemmatimonadaceae bacterium]